MVIKKIVAPATIYKKSITFAGNDKRMLPEFDDLLFPWIGKTAKVGSFFLSEVFRLHQIDLNKEQFLLLLKLYQQDGRPQQQLAFITNRDKTSLARLITTLEKKALVKRAVSKEDKRINLIYLTTSGRKLFQKTLPIGKKALENVQSGISEEEITITIHTLKKVMENILKEKQQICKR